MGNFRLYCCTPKSNLLKKCLSMRFLSLRLGGKNMFDNSKEKSQSNILSVFVVENKPMALQTIQETQSLCTKYSEIYINIYGLFIKS